MDWLLAFLAGCGIGIGTLIEGKLRDRIDYAEKALDEYKEKYGG